MIGYMRGVHIVNDTPDREKMVLVKLWTILLTNMDCSWQNSVASYIN